VDLSFNLVDIAVVGVLLLSALVAFGLGFSRTVLYFTAWAVAIFAAWRFYPLGTPYAQKYLPDQFAEGAAAFFIFLGVLLVCWLIAHLITKGIRRSVFSTVDRVLGLVLGLGIGAGILSVAYVMVDWMFKGAEEDRPAWLMEARTLPYLTQGADFMRPLLPDQLFKNAPLQGEELRQRAEGAAAEQAAAAATGGTATDGTAPPAEAQPQGYTDSERQGIDRAVQGTDQRPDQGTDQGTSQ
jgi:membrane protein required for colicin V production